MKVVFLHPPMYPVNHEFFNILGRSIDLIVYQFGTHPLHHKHWTVDKFLSEDRNYEIKIFGSGPVTFSLQANPAFLKALKDDKPDIVVSIAFWLPSLYASLFKHILGYKFLVSTDAICETEKNLSFMKRQIRNIICKNSDALISASDLTTEYLKQLDSNAEIFQSYQTINTKVWTKEIEVLSSKDLLRKELNLPNDATILLGVGNFIYKKNWESILEYLNKLGNCFFVLVGDGELEMEYIKIIKEKKIEDKVMIVGRKEGRELKKYFKSADILVFPSLNDQFGFVVPEALSVGLPVLCSKFSGASSLIQNGYNGFVVDPRDNYFEKIQKIENHLTEMQKNAKSSALSLTLEKRAEEFYDIFESIMEK